MDAGLIELVAAPLTAAAFAPFGEVIEIEARAARSINAGTCERFDDLAQLDVAADGGRPLLSIFRAAPRALPLRIHSLERHPLSSQAFFPLTERPFLVVVAAAGDRPRSSGVRAFLSSGSQGVNYRRNTWHHELLALGERSQFLVVDRGGPGENCQSLPLEGQAVWVRLR